MRFSGIPVIVLAAIAAFSTAALAQNAATDEPASEARDAALIDRYMTDIPTELTGNVDSSNAAVGQEITARTRDAATLADGTALPKGTKLVGHVIQVAAQSKNQPAALLAITFDRAQFKDGSSLALRSVIRSVGPPAHIGAKPFPTPDPTPVRSRPIATGGVDGGPPASGGNAPSVSTGGGGATGTRGGLGDDEGGLGGDLPGPTTRTVGQRTGLSPDMASAAGGTMPVAMAGDTTSTAPRATALPGVMLANSAGANVSGVLIASGKNISLNSGTQITLGVISNQPKPAQP